MDVVAGVLNALLVGFVAVLVVKIGDVRRAVEANGAAVAATMSMLVISSSPAGQHLLPDLRRYTRNGTDSDVFQEALYGLTSKEGMRRATDDRDMFMEAARKAGFEVEVTKLLENWITLQVASNAGCARAFRDLVRATGKDAATAALAGALLTTP